MKHWRSNISTKFLYGTIPPWFAEGTGLYIQALCNGLDIMPETDPAIAAATEAEYEQRGIAWLQQAVAAEDPEFYCSGEITKPRAPAASAYVYTHKR